MEPVLDAVTGWRAWNLSEDAGSPLLLPSGAGVDTWPRGHPLEARCSVPAIVRPRRRDHDVPEPSCRCGVYANRSLDAFSRRRPAWLPPPVIGRVSMWGRTVEHEQGWRARFAYPARLRLVCAMCAWVEPGPGVPAVVHGFGRLRYAFCRRHRGGVEVPDGRRTTVLRTDPEALQARLLDAYSVDLLPLEAIEELFARPAALPEPGSKPAIRAVRPAE